MSRWETDVRYCAAKVKEDLLGNTIVLTTYGGRFNRLGRLRAYVMVDQAAREARILELHKVRLRHGYELVVNCSGIELARGNGNAW